MSNNNGAKPEQEYPKLIFKAEIVKDGDKLRVAFTRKSTHIPTLDYVVQQLSYEIIELRAIEKTKEEKAKIGPITKGPMMSLTEFLKRGRKR